MEIGRAFHLSTNDEAFDALVDATVSYPLATRIRYFLRDWRAAGDDVEARGIAVLHRVDTSDDSLRDFVAYGPMQVLLDDPRAKEVVSRIVIRMDALRTGAEVHDVVRARLDCDEEWTPDDWHLLEEASALVPYAYACLTEVLERLVHAFHHGDADCDHDRQCLLLLGDRLSVETYPPFRRSNGVNDALLLVHDGTFDPAPGLRLLIRCLFRFPDYVVHAPSLVRAVDRIADVPNDTDGGGWRVAFLQALVRAAGTTIVVRIVQEQGETSCLLRRLADGFSDVARAEYVALWPDVVAPAVQYAGAAAPATPCVDHECPITHDPCCDPVVASDGHTYERDTILRYMMKRPGAPSPLTRDPLDTFVVPNRSLKAAWFRNTPPPLPKASSDA